MFALHFRTIWTMKPFKIEPFYQGDLCVTLYCLIFVCAISKKEKDISFQQNFNKGNGL